MEEYPNDKETQEWMNAPMGKPASSPEDQVIFWSNKYDEKVDDLHRSQQSCIRQMKKIDDLMQEIFLLKKETERLKNPRNPHHTAWALLNAWENETPGGMRRIIGDRSRLENMIQNGVNDLHDKIDSIQEKFDALHLRAVKSECLSSNLLSCLKTLYSQEYAGDKNHLDEDFKKWLKDKGLTDEI